MNLSLMKIRTVFPFFNERAVTAEDFWRAAKRLKITVRQMPLTVDGYYTQRRGRCIILIDSKLSGIRWLHTALHEMHHYLFDVPGAEDGYTFYRNGKYIDPREYKADAFALICLLPWPDLVQTTIDEVNQSPMLADLVRDRIVVRTHFGI